MLLRDKLVALVLYGSVRVLPKQCQETLPFLCVSSLPPCTFNVVDELLVLFRCRVHYWLQTNSSDQLSEDTSDDHRVLLDGAEMEHMS